MHGVLLPQPPYDSDEWHEQRRKSLGASEVAAALGFSPWQSAYSLWALKTGRMPEQESNDAMRLGQLLEPVILDEFARESGLIVGYRGHSFRHPDEEWATASPDGLGFESPPPEKGKLHPLGLVEAKTDFSLWEEIPDHYVLQGDWQMWVLDLDRVWFPLLATGTRKFRVYELERDAARERVVVDAARDFWQYVVDDREPPVDAHEATGKALAAVHSHASDDVIELPADAADALAELRQVRMRLDELGERKSYLENVVKQAIGDATVGTVSGAEVVSWKQQSRTSIDSGRLRREMPEVAEKFERTTEFRVFRTKEVK